MTTKSIHIVPDAAHPEGGFAVIRLDGVWLLHDTATYRIEPLGEGHVVDARENWHTADQIPLDVRTTSRGIELVVGPGVVDASRLYPGKLAAISIPAADVEVEVVWPNLPKSRSRRANGNAVVGQSDTSVASPPAVANANGLSNGAAVSAGHAPPEHSLFGATNRNGSYQADLGGTYHSRDAQTVQSRSSSRLAEDGLIIDHNGHDDTPLLAKSTTRALPPPRRNVWFSPLAMFSAGLVATGAVLFVAWSSISPNLVSRDEPSLSEIFTVGDTSPRGTDARNFERDDALLLANQFVHGIERAADKKEGAFWLRKALSLKLANEQMTWALTQLGSIYASSTADYQSARMLWELAGVNGDPVSLCFVGRLYEYGLGVTASREKALASYEKAQSLGGCPGLEAALARVGK